MGDVLRVLSPPLLESGFIIISSSLFSLDETLSNSTNLEDLD